MNQAESQLAAIILSEGFKLVANVITAARAKGVDLDKLLDDARADNMQSVFDVLGIENVHPPAPPPPPPIEDETT